MTIVVELTSYPGLDRRITILRAGDEVDAVFVRTERFDVLIDTLGTPQLCRQALDLVGAGQSRPLMVINSHMDWDHFWGNAAIAGSAPIIAHNTAIRRFREPAIRRTLDEKMAEDIRFADVELIPPTIGFDGDMLLDGGDLTLRLIHTPGHTPDHIVVFIPEIKTCLAIDAVEDPIPEVWSSNPDDLRLLRASLETIRQLDCEFVVLAHGQTASPETVFKNIAYFDQLAERVGSLDQTALYAADPSRLSGLALRDFVALSVSMPAETLAFYEKCHASNLAATIRTRIEADEVKTGTAG